MGPDDNLSKSEIDAKLRQLDQGLDELKREYDQFFVGSKERPPRNKRKKVERLVRELERANVTNTSQQFKMRGLVQRFNSYKTKWNRIEREIEEGTYEPHQKRAERRVGDVDPREQAASDSEEEQPADEAEEGADDDAIDLDFDASDLDLEEVEEELQEMDEEGEFEKYVETERMSERDFEEAEREREEQTPRANGPGHEASSDREESARRPDPRNLEESDDGGGAKKEKLREIQDKLGLSSGGGSEQSGADRGATDQSLDDRKEKLQSMRERLESEGGGDSGGGRPNRGESDRSGGRGDDTELPTGGAKRDDVERIRRDKDEMVDKQQGGGQPRRPQPDGSTSSERGGSQQNRSSDREGSRRRRDVDRHSRDRGSSDEESDDDDEREAQLYRRLLKLKEENGEATDHLSLAQVRESMDRRREELRREHDVDGVEFRIVRKDERTCLQPQFEQ